MSKLIEVKNASFSYPSDEGDSIEVLKDFSFEVEKGEFVAVLGHNGSGKSTLAKLFNGLLIPSDGKVLVDGMDTADEEQKFNIRRKVGMVFQNPDNQLVATIVEEDVAFGPENLGIEPSKIRERVDYALKTVGMYKYRTHAPHKLSGGQKQRVAIAGIIAMEPECIIFDESTAMLDPKGRKEVLETIKKLNREKGITVIMITHYMDEAAMADRVVVIHDGEKVIDGTPYIVFSQVDYLKSISLDVPQATELAYKLKNEGYDIGDDILNEKEFTEKFAKFIKEKKSCL